MKIIKTQTEIIAPQAILDIEITNDLRPFNWDYTKADVWVVGIYYGNTITQIYKENSNKVELYDFKNEIQKTLSELTMTYFALNEKFETNVLKTLTIKRFRILELRGNIIRFTRGASKDNLYQLLQQTKPLTYKDVPDPLNGDASKISECWNNFQKTKNSIDLQKVLDHNKHCLIKENAIHNEIQFTINFLDKFNPAILNCLKKMNELYK